MKLFQTLKKFMPNVSRMMASTSSKPFTILVEGNIGCGKTTFLNHFKDNPNILTVSEPVHMWTNVKGNNLLHLMYADADKWSFTFQTYVQLTMLKVHQIQTEKPMKMMERSLFSARYCFVENLYRQNNLEKAQEVVLDEWFNWLVSENLVPCDLIIYIKTDPKVAYERVKKRSRPEENLVSLEFVERMHNYHEKWLSEKTSFSIPAPVLVLNGSKNPTEIVQQYQSYERIGYRKQNISG